MSDIRFSRMFPLGSVLVPSAPLPLHIFEPRYQELLNQSLEDDRTFAVTLISRGHEVGGGDQRVAIGTVARIEEYNRFDDGRAAVVSLGVSRIRVDEWLPDDPYPRAMVVDLPEPEPTAEDIDRFAQVSGELEALVETARQSGRLGQAPSFDWSDDLVTAVWQLATVAPLAVFDRQRVLEADTIAERLTILDQAIADVHDDVRRMAEIDGEPPA